MMASGRNIKISQIGLVVIPRQEAAEMTLFPLRKITPLFSMVLLLNTVKALPLLSQIPQENTYQNRCVAVIKRWIEGKAPFTSTEATAMAQRYCAHVGQNLNMDCLTRSYNYALSSPLYNNRQAVV
ncbi:MAG: hypothetical protein RMI92_01140 [Geminocystis sp.]|nr:hypothetical protein [Geminocystis sp.]